MVEGSIAYYGTYVLDDTTLKMHIDASTFPNRNWHRSSPYPSPERQSIGVGEMQRHQPAVESCGRFMIA